MGIFKEAIYEDDELSDDRGEGDFGGLAVFSEPQIEGFQDDVDASNEGHVVTLDNLEKPSALKSYRLCQKSRHGPICPRPLPSLARTITLRA